MSQLGRNLHQKRKSIFWFKLDICLDFFFPGALFLCSAQCEQVLFVQPVCLLRCDVISIDRLFAEWRQGKKVGHKWKAGFFICDKDVQD